ELLDGNGGKTALKDAIKNYQAMKDLVEPVQAPARAAAGRAKPAAAAAGKPAAATPAAAAKPAAAKPAATTPAGAATAAAAPTAASHKDETQEKPVTMSATGAVLGSPILRSQGMTGDITSRKLTLQPGKPDRPPGITAAAKWSKWRDCRS